MKLGVNFWRAAFGAKRPFIAKGASGLATGKECAKPYQSSQDSL